MPCLGQRFEAPGLIVDLNTSDPFRVDFLCPQTLFSVQLGRRSYEIGLSSDRLVKRTLPPGAVSLSPMGSTVTARTGAHNCEFLAFAFDNGKVSEALDACGRRPMDIRIDPDLRQPQLLHLARAMRGFFAHNEDRTAIYGETLAFSILLAVLNAQERAKPQSEARMTKGMVALVCEYIEENLDTTLALSDLAAIANLTVYQFSRAFKAANNVPPHQYVVDRRIERAREMLCDPEVAIADVAYATGFSSQAHMTDLFKKRLGTTPGAYRREVL